MDSLNLIAIYLIAILGAVCMTAVVVGAFLLLRGHPTSYTKVYVGGGVRPINQAVWNDPDPGDFPDNEFRDVREFGW